MGTSRSKPEALTKDTLPQAVAELFRMNNYDVREDVHIHGAQVDLVAHSRTDQFAPNIFVEVTVEYVNTEKYGKDATKFLLVQRAEQSCVCLSILA